MTGLFEDDSNVRPSKKVPKKTPEQASNKAPSKKSKGVGSKIVAKVESRDVLVEAASTVGAVSFEEVDVVSAKRGSSKQQEDGRITPLIDYVSDRNDSV